MTSDDGGPQATYAQALGARLRHLREQRRLSLTAVQDRSGGEFKASVLGAYERGARAISVPRLQRLATLYDVPVDQLLPVVGDRPTSGPAGGRAASPSVRVDLEALRQAPGAEAGALRHFVAQVEIERQDFNGRVLTVRRDDVRVIGAALGLSLEETLRRLGDAGVLADAAGPGARRGERRRGPPTRPPAPGGPGQR
ncbi:MAG: helix-turn-helix domain-containing protein [Acidimicrobiales bacterium]